MDSDLHGTHSEQPQRLSALYQYHNAPEVAPAHGLEYDDAPYAHSDKYPVIRELNYADSYHGKHAYTPTNNKPPRIIFGMKVPTFLMVAAVMVLVVVGAAVGGAVGGRSLRSGVSDNGMGTVVQPSIVTGSIAPTATSNPSSTFSAATPTYTPISDCPASNNTSYTSSYAKGSSGTVPESAGLNFTKYCDLRNPLSDPSASRIAEAFVYTFSDCVELCAGYNFWNAGHNCTVAVYQVGGGRPGNCWIGSSQNVKASALGVQQGTDVALLTSKS